MRRVVEPGSIGSEHGQVAVGFIAIVPTLVLITLALLQFALVGHATLSAATAARAAARADYVGSDAERAARAALAPGLRRSAEVELGDDAIEVEVRAARSLPIGAAIPVTAAARLGPPDGLPGG